MKKIGIIGGSGLDNPDILQNARDVEVITPYGAPSSPLRVGTIEGHEVVFIARHGREHTHTPTGVNYRANIYALKKAGCDCVLTSTACGSLREEIDRGHLVVLDQFIDFTRRRHLTYADSFSEGGISHTPMADPFDEPMRQALIEACAEKDITFHPTGTMITIEGPRFSTRAESNMFRMWGADVINMSIAPECILANEIGLPYASIAMSTDYDCWKTDEDPVTWDDILKVFKQNAEKVQTVLIEVVKKLNSN